MVSFRIMSAVTLKAHFNGKQIILDEPYPLAPDAQLIVTVLPALSDELVKTREAFAEAAARELSRAFGDDEPEYTVADLRNGP
jgi:hypothetical protein